jgi:outer membrane protein TolC
MNSLIIRRNQDLKRWLFLQCIIFLFIIIVFSSFAHSTSPSFIVADSLKRASMNDGSESSAIPASETEPDQSSAQKMSLEKIINRALAANRTLKDSSDQVDRSQLSIVAAEAEFELKIQPGARVDRIGSNNNSDSSFGAGVDVRRKFSVGTEIGARPDIQKTADDFQSGIDLSFSQPLLRGVSRDFNLANIQNAEFGARTSRRSLYLTQVNTVVSAVSAAYDVVRQRELVRINEASARRLKTHAEAAKAKEKIGLATPIDVYRALIQLNDAEDNLATVREAYYVALDNLKILLALPFSKAIEVEAPLEYSMFRILEEQAVKTALKNRVELDQAADTVREARRQSRIAKHNILPEMNVVLNYSRFDRGDTLSESASFGQDAWGLSLVTVTDIKRTVERANYKQSLISVKGALRSESLQRDEVVREAKREHRNLRRQEQRIKIQQDQIQDSKGQLELAQIKFRWGLADNFDVIDAEETLRRAETNLLSVVIDYIIGTYRLRRVMGTLIAKPERF